MKERSFCCNNIIILSKFKKMRNTDNRKTMKRNETIFIHIKQTQLAKERITIMLYKYRSRWRRNLGRRRKGGGENRKTEEISCLVHGERRRRIRRIQIISTL